MAHAHAPRRAGTLVLRSPSQQAGDLAPSLSLTVLQANFISQYCGETNGNDLLNVGEYWADLRSSPPSLITLPDSAKF